MIVYGHHSYRLNVPTFLRDAAQTAAHLPAIPSRDQIVDLLVDTGEAYSAVADALAPLRDNEGPQLWPWRDALAGIARALCGSVDDDREAVGAGVAAYRNAMTALAHAPPHGDVSARCAEGFAHYSLYPEQYMLAGERIVDRFAPAALTCIGVRTIGVSLAHIVAAAAGRRGVPTHVFTVRPRSHPFDRRLELTERFRRRIRDSGASLFAIVDEGPGISGSSFAAVSDALLELGIDADRIVLVPSWEPPDSALRSERGRATWQRHARIGTSFEEVFSITPTEELSGGQWRRRVFGRDLVPWPAVHAQHERRKYLHISPTASLVSRFAGLGRYGRAKLARAELLADRGLTTRPVDLTHGFLTQEWVAGTPLLAEAPRSPATMDRIASYIGFIAGAFPTGQRAGVDDLLEMMRVNIAEGLGPDHLGAVDALARDAVNFEQPEVAIDGRMLPHEWLSTPGGLLKVDALDHHGDDFFPRSRDIAWDVAGVIVEFGLHGDAADRLVAGYGAQAGDTTIALRLPFYRAAYLAYRLGYATMAAEALGRSLDGLRFTALAEHYRRSLERLAPTSGPVQGR